MRSFTTKILAVLFLFLISQPVRGKEKEIPSIYDSRDDVPRYFSFVTDNPKFNRMWTETIVEILSRQLQNGQLIESSTDSGLYPNTFPRNVCPLILLKSGYYREVRRYLDFMWKEQKGDGSFWNYFDNKGKGGGILEEDGGAYVVYHTLKYVQYTGDQEYLKRRWTGIRKSLDYLGKLFEPDVGLFYSTAGYSEGNVKGGYNIYHQAITMLAMRSGAEIARMLGKKHEMEEYLNLLESVKGGIQGHLINEERKRYFFQLKPDGSHFDKPFPAPLILSYYDLIDPGDEAMAGSVDFILSGPLYGEFSRDIFGLEGIDVERVTGSGFWMGQAGHGWLIPYFLKVGRLAEADRWFRGLVNATDNATYLVPEHINWSGFDPDGGGWEGHIYGVLPDSSAWVDPGNLYALATAMHMVFTMVDVDVSDRDQRVYIRVPSSLGLVAVTNLRSFYGTIDLTYKKIEGGEEITLSGQGDGELVLVGKDPEGRFLLMRDGDVYDDWKLDASGRIKIGTDFKPHSFLIKHLSSGPVEND